MDISYIPLTPAHTNTYIDVGKRAYNQHYRHLWINQDSSPYINSSFTQEVLGQEVLDPNNAHFILYANVRPVGILKLIVNCAFQEFSDIDSLLVQKIYILKEYSGQGIGTATLNFVQSKALLLQKKILWLDTMKKGPAYFFYLKNGFKVAGTCRLTLPAAIESEREMYQMLSPDVFKVIDLQLPPSLPLYQTFYLCIVMTTMPRILSNILG